MHKCSRFLYMYNKVVLAYNFIIRNQLQYNRNQMNLNESIERFVSKLILNSCFIFVASTHYYQVIETSYPDQQLTLGYRNCIKFD